MDELVSELTTILKDKQFKIATAESCTGGLVAGLLTELAGSSLWFERGFVTYSDVAKQEMLAVNPALIKAHGAVSQEVAEAMANGALAKSHSDITLAVTGIAGPDGGSPLKPVGTVWFAWAMTDHRVQSQCFCFKNEHREGVRRLACQQALAGAIRLLKTNNNV